MAVKIGKYHLFKRQQDTGTFWYYWFEDGDGKRVQRSCGHGCESKRDATAFLEELYRADLLEDKRKAELRKDIFYKGTSKNYKFSHRFPHFPNSLKI